MAKNKDCKKENKKNSQKNCPNTGKQSSMKENSNDNQEK